MSKRTVYQWSMVGLILAAALLVAIPRAGAHTGEWAAIEALAGDLRDAGLTQDTPVKDVLETVIARAMYLPAAAGQPYLPQGTVLDEASWVDNVLNVRLTLPVVESEWLLEPLDVESLSSACAEPFAADDSFGGVRVWVRMGADDEYGTLARLLPPPPAPQPELDLSELEPYQPTASGEANRAGPTTNAARQPTGALSGVTVFASAGHGWTAGTSAWYLQRPVLLNMVEDYGNIDQLNYFAQFAFNAGATVVPLRPIGWQPIEIVLDNDDPGVTYTGSWSTSSSSRYYENGVTTSGDAYRWTSTSTTESGTARYSPTITQTDFYPVYCFTLASTNRVLQTYRISHSGGISEVAVDHHEVGSGWIWLGDYYFEAGGDNYVEITNESDETGVVVADAIRFGGGTGDVVRPGPGTISGYPRDEEAQRYWGESEWGNNAVGFDDSIWDLSSAADGSDNVGTGARIAREMNQVPDGGELTDRWRRVHLEFHSNASSGSARGQICLVTSLGATTYQTELATILSNEVDADLLIADSDFEHEWVDRSSSTATGAYGAIATGANSDEFDATIVELAFHDNESDAQLLRDPVVRAAMGRACVHGIIRFLNSLPDSEVPLSFAPDTPGTVAVEDLGGGDVQISWTAPLVDGARGDAATGYVVYQSTNGYGFGNPIILGDVTSTIISNVPTSETHYYRVAATNAGGESMPSEVVALRRPETGTAEVLIVNGYDRMDRFITPLLTFTQPPAYDGDTIQRQVWRRTNSYDYVVQHAEALAAADMSFATCANELVESAAVPLAAYELAVWILGNESVDDETFSLLEQSRLEDFLEDGGGLFVSGSELAWDLINQGGGTNFAQNILHIGYSADDAGTYNVTAASGGIFDGMSAFDFAFDSGAPYDVRTPDILTAGTDASICLYYSGGSGGGAGVQYAGGASNIVTFGFPFETITSQSTRNEVMQHIIDYLLSAEGPLPFDWDHDGDVDGTDLLSLQYCYVYGPDHTFTPTHYCVNIEGEEDDDIDLHDYQVMQVNITGPQ